MPDSEKIGTRQLQEVIQVYSVCDKWRIIQQALVAASGSTTV